MMAVQCPAVAPADCGPSRIGPWDACALCDVGDCFNGRLSGLKADAPRAARYGAGGVRMCVPLL